MKAKDMRCPFSCHDKQQTPQVYVHKELLTPMCCLLAEGPSIVHLRKAAGDLVMVYDWMTQQQQMERKQQQQSRPGRGDRSRLQSFISVLGRFVFLMDEVLKQQA